VAEKLAAEVEKAREAAGLARAVSLQQAAERARFNEVETAALAEACVAEHERRAVAQAAAEVHIRACRAAQQSAAAEVAKAEAILADALYKLEQAQADLSPAAERESKAVSAENAARIEASQSAQLLSDRRTECRKLEEELRAIGERLDGFQQEAATFEEADARREEAREHRNTRSRPRVGFARPARRIRPAFVTSLPRPVVLFIALFALLAPFDGLLNITMAGTITKYVGIAVIALGLLEIIQRQSIVVPGRELYAWGLFIGLSLLSLMWAISRDSSKGYLVTVLSLFLLFAVVCLLPYRRQDFLIISAATVAGGLLLSFYSLYLEFHSSNAVIMQGGSRLYLTIPGYDNVADANHVAAAVILPIALAIAFAIRSESRTRRLLYLCSTPVLLMGLWESGSRGGLLGLCALALYCMLRSRARLPFVTVSLLGAVAFFEIPNNTFVLRFIEDRSMGSGRGDLWHVGLTAFREHWLYGAGAANFVDAYDETVTRTSQQLFQSWHRPAHNILMSTAVDLGILGVAALIFVAYEQFRTLRSINITSPLYDFRIALESTLIALATVALFVDVVPRKYVWLIFIEAAVLRIAAGYPDSPQIASQARHLSLGRRPTAELTAERAH
jgi:hypothetical protein